MPRTATITGGLIGGDAETAAYSPSDVTKWGSVNPETVKKALDYAAANFPSVGGTPGGSNTQVQYNNAGAFGGITGATTNGTALTLVAPVLGTPASGVLANCTGLPISTGVSGLATGIATFLGSPSSANLIAAVTNETGTGALVFGTSPTIVTPTIADFTNANHTHANAVGGGGLNATAITAGQLIINRGGTGAASFTAYAVICGGVTAIDPLQSVASVGTAGQILTSNGAGALPTFQAITNASTITVKDTLFTIQDDGDTTKQLQFQCSGITTATTRTLTVPNASDTIAVLATAQTFTAAQTLGTTTKTQYTDANAFINASSSGNLVAQGATLTTIGVVGDIGLGDGTLRKIYPLTPKKIDLGSATNPFNQAFLGSTVGRLNDISTAGLGVPAIYSAPAISATQTANFTVLTYTPPATAGVYRVSSVITTTSATNTGTLQMTVDYVDSQGTTHTADVLPAQLVSGTTSGWDADGTVTSAASKEFVFGPKLITINNAATAIVLKVVITGTVSYTVAGTVEQLV